MSDIIACVSLGISILALIYTLISNTKKYELEYQHRKEIIDWYSKTNEIIIKLMHGLGEKNEIKICDLSLLSSQIEVGRMFFPNIVIDNYGSEKPAAYRGYRNTIIEILVMNYNLYKYSDEKKYNKHAEMLQKLFTSYVFESIDVRKFNDKIKRNTGKIFDSNNINDYLANEPDQAKLYAYFPK